MPEELTLEELSGIRAQFITDCGWGTPEDVRKSFIERDNTLKSYEKYEELILWFEHDLYDQLQILQILDWLFYHPSSLNVKVSLICTENYLGMLSADEMKGLLEYKEPISKKHLLLANMAWSALRSSSPEKWQDLLNSNTSILPFLNGAITRLLEEYPSCYNGLSRTASQALQILSEGEEHFITLFCRYQESESRRFMGDTSFWEILQELLESHSPLVQVSDGGELERPGNQNQNQNQKLKITSTGREVLKGEKNWLEIVEIDRWIGGVHLTKNNLWCWNSKAGLVIKKS